MKDCMELHIGILFLKNPLATEKIKMAANFQDGRDYYRLTVLFNVNELNYDLSCKFLVKKLV